MPAVTPVSDGRVSNLQILSRTDKTEAILRLPIERVTSGRATGSHHTENMLPSHPEA